MSSPDQFKDSDPTTESFNRARTESDWRNLYKSTFATLDQYHKAKDTDSYEGTLNLNTVRAFIKYLERIDQQAAARFQHLLDTSVTEQDREFINEHEQDFIDAVKSGKLSN